MSLVAGIDVSTKYVDIVWIDEDIESGWKPVWQRVTLVGNDAWERTRSIAYTFPSRSTFDETIAIGVEVAHGLSSGAVNRCVGAVLTKLPIGTLVKPWTAGEWKKAVGLKGNCSKWDVGEHASRLLWQISKRGPDFIDYAQWPQDAYDAYCIALATRGAIQVGEAAA